MRWRVCVQSYCPRFIVWLWISSCGFRQLQLFESQRASSASGYMQNLFVLRLCGDVHFCCLVVKILIWLNIHCHVSLNVGGKWHKPKQWASNRFRGAASLFIQLKQVDAFWYWEDNISEVVNLKMSARLLYLRYDAVAQYLWEPLTLKGNEVGYTLNKG